MTEEGYDVELLQGTSAFEDLYCVICMKLLRNPVQFKCGHGTCRGCFKKLLQRTKQRNCEGPQCPQCREVVLENQVTSNVMLHRHILSLKVRCCKERHDCCTWFGTLSDHDEHLLVYGNSPSKKNNSKPVKQKRCANKAFPDTMQGNVNSSIVECFMSLKRRIDEMEGKSSTNSDVSGDVDNRHHHKSIKFQFNQILNNAWTKCTRAFIATYIAWFLLFVVVTRSVIYTMPNSSNVTSDVNAKCRQNNDVENDIAGIQSALKNLTSKSNSQFGSFFQFVWQGLNYRLFHLQRREAEILQEIPDMHVTQNRSMVELDKRFSYLMEQSRIDINKNISCFDDDAQRKLSVDNVESLVNVASLIFNAFSRRTFEEIAFEEFRTLDMAERLYTSVRRDLWTIRQEADFILTYQFRDNLYCRRLATHRTELAEFRDNVTRSYRAVNKDKLRIVVVHDFTQLRYRFEHTLKEYSQNITKVLTQEQRFKTLMQRVQNVDLKNGCFVWKLDSRNVLRANKDYVFESKKFQTGSTGRGMLLFYKNTSRTEYYKMTFVQYEARAVTISLSIMNQIRPGVLLFNETQSGRFLSREKADFKKYYEVSMNATELKEKGFILNDQIFIRCVTVDHHQR